jgi:NRPS condensation-like uncharacterized protein
MRELQTLEPAGASDSSERAPSVMPTFPLRLTPFEYYYLLEDRPDYPSVFCVRLECRGALDRQAFERAFQIAHARHPLLSARLQRDRDGWPMWVSGDVDPIVWNGAGAAPRQEFLGQTLAPRLQLSVIQTGDRTTFDFLFHHVAVDGLGGFHFINDLMVAYHHACTGDQAQLTLGTLDPQLLRIRNEHTLFNRGFRWIDLIRYPRVAVPLLFQRVALLSQRENAPSTTAQLRLPTEFLTHTLTEQETAQLTSIARKQSVRLHELLLRDFFLMLAAWNEGSNEARRPMRVLVPTDLRRRPHRHMPAANLFGYTFLTRRAKHCQDRDQLLHSIREETSEIKSTGRAMYHEANLHIGCLWTPLIRSTLDRKSPFATAVFTNLNASFNHVPLPWRDGKRAAGELVFENGYGAGPLRPNTRVSLAVHNYVGRITLAFRCDQYAFPPDQQQAIVQAYLDQIAKTLACET